MKRNSGCEILVCKCGDVSHQLVVRTDPDGDVIVTMHLNRLPLFERIVNAIMYIFGAESVFGDFEEIVLGKEHADQLQKVVDTLRKLED